LLRRRFCGEWENYADRGWVPVSKVEKTENKDMRDTFFDGLSAVQVAFLVDRLRHQGSASTRVEISGRYSAASLK
jgi:hypothetical protein